MRAAAPTPRTGWARCVSPPAAWCHLARSCRDLLTFGAACSAASICRRRGLGAAGLGAASILAGVLYTGGPRPYGYEGLGELFVFLFFGIVAVAGSYFVQVQRLPWEAFALAVPVVC